MRAGGPGLIRVGALRVDVDGGVVAEVDGEATVELLVGRIGRAHGLRGEVIIDVRTDEPDQRFAAGTTFATARGTLTIASTKWHGQRLLATIDGVYDRSAAEGLRGTDLRLEVPRDDRPADPDEFYDHQLVGLRVETEAGESIGEVTEVLHLPAQDVIVVPHEGRDVLVPFVSEFVPVVDLDSRRLVVVDRPGLLEESLDDDADTDAGT
jgi:16S rRNA processing protein RimM